MPLPNIFTHPVAGGIIERIRQLTPSSTPAWGKMNVAEMLAHCNVTYELVYDNKHPEPGFFFRLMLKLFVKKPVTNEVPYKHHSRTAPQFLITGMRDFETEKARLVSYILRTQELGEMHFHNKTSHSFGRLSSAEWNNMFYKHLDHHLRQFGV